MPKAPRPGEDFMRHLGYWTTLQGFLTHSFGWARHDRGLRWWYDAGKPVDEPRFGLIDAVWGQDGYLMAYAEWCHDRLATFDHQALAEWTTYDSSPDPLSRAWQQRLSDARDDSVHDGTTPHGKHLEGGDHASGPTSHRFEAKIAVISLTDRRAVYTCETGLGWYRGLVELGSRLPLMVNASWRIEVYVRPIGYVGTYRRSRVTGLWFSGQHRFHTVGN
jgi:hypothetical protein